MAELFDSAGWDIPRMLGGLSSLSAPAPEASTIPQAREASTNVDLPQLPKGGGVAEFIQQAVATMAPSLMSSPQLGQNLQALILKQQEQRREQKSAQETQSLTGFLSAALSSGNPEQIGSAIKQMSGLKGLEPETVKALQSLQVKLGESIGQDQKEEQLAKALEASTDSELSQAVKAIIKGSPGVKISDAIKLVQSGLLGERSKTMNVAELGVVKIPGSGIFAKPNEQPSVILGAPGKERDLIPSSTQVELERAGVRLGGRTRMSDVNPGEWSKLNVEASKRRLDEKRDALEIAASIRAQDRADAPINEKALFYVDPSTLMNPSPDTSRTDLGAAVKGGKLVSIRPADVQNIREMKARVEQLLDMRRLAQRLLATAPGENITRAVQLAVQRGLASSADAALFNGWGTALSLQVASDFNKGRPSDADRQAVQGVLFNERDTVKTSVGKIDELIKHYDRLASKNLGVSIDPRKTGSAVSLPGASRRVQTLPEGFK